MDVSISNSGDKLELSIKCAKCKKDLKIEMVDIKNEKTITCPDCGNNNELKDE